MDVIKAYDGQRVHSAMIDAIVAQEMQRQTDARVKELEAEVARLEAELEIRKQRDGRMFSRFIADAERDYPEPGRGTLVGKVGWALLGWLVLAFSALFDALGV